MVGPPWFAIVILAGVVVRTIGWGPGCGSGLLRHGRGVALTMLFSVTAFDGLV